MKDIVNHYRELLFQYGDSPKSAQWADEQSQFRRFEVLNQIDNLKEKSILDYGCGCAAFSQYLDSVDQRPSVYCGVDIVEEFFSLARVKRPDGIFMLPSQMTDDMKFDYSFVSGVFNNKTGSNSIFWRETIKTLFAISNQGVAFNMLSTYVQYKDDNLYYASPLEVFDFVKRKLTPFVSIIHDYKPRLDSYPYEFTVFLRKNPGQ